MSTNPASNPLTTDNGSVLFDGDNDNTAGAPMAKNTICRVPG